MTYSVSKDRKQRPSQTESSHCIAQTTCALPGSTFGHIPLPTPAVSGLLSPDSSSFDSCGHFRHAKIKRSPLQNTGVHFCGAFVPEKMDRYTEDMLINREKKEDVFFYYYYSESARFHRLIKFPVKKMRRQ